MRSGVVISSILAGAFSLPGSAAEAIRPEKQQFTVATFNVNWGNPDLAGIVTAISQSQADLVALQETNNVSARFLRRNLARQYPHMKFRPPPGRYLAAGFGFLSKVPLKDFRFLEAKDGLFGTWICQGMLSGRPVQIVNVHLQPLVPPSERGFGAALRAFGRLEAIHAKEIERIGAVLSTEMPVLVLGDFNSPSTLTAPRSMLKKGFVDSFASVTEEPDRHPTWRWRVGEADLAFRVDYIFHSRKISTVESRVIKTDASDHDLVVSKLEIPLKAVGRGGPR